MGKAPESTGIKKGILELVSKFLKTEWPDKHGVSVILVLNIIIFIIQAKNLSWVLGLEIHLHDPPIAVMNNYTTTVFPGLLSENADVVEDHAFLSLDTLSLYFKVNLL